MLFNAATLLSVLSILSIATAAPYDKHHKHLRHAKREAEAEPAVVTVTTVVQIANVAAAATTSSSSTSEALAATLNVVENAAVVGTSSSSSATSAEWEQTTLSTSTTSSVATSTSASSTASNSAANTAAAGSVEYYANMGKGISYSPYTDSGSCKSASVIESDIALLSSFDIIRVYAPDCSVITAMLNAMSSSQQILAGLYYLDSLSTDVSTLASQVTASSRGWDAIYAVSVGNEWVNGGTYDAATVVSAISTARTLLSAQGYSGNVVTVDTAPAFENNPSLCTASDFAAVNQHAFWNGAIAPEDSGAFIQDTITTIKSICDGKDVLITETGWPTQGSTYGTLGVPGTSEQLACIKSIAETVPDNVIFFTTYNDYWKSAGTYGVEQYWGIFD